MPVVLLKSLLLISRFPPFCLPLLCWMRQCMIYLLFVLRYTRYLLIFLFRHPIAKNSFVKFVNNFLLNFVSVICFRGISITHLALFTIYHLSSIQNVFMIFLLFENLFYFYFKSKMLNSEIHLILIFMIFLFIYLFIHFYFWTIEILMDALKNPEHHFVNRYFRINC